jgi:acyl dehydratase
LKIEDCHQGHSSFFILYSSFSIMALITVSSYDEFASYLGKELGKSEWLEVSQERINLFADATLDYQWIHVDTERAKVESPYKSTIAHGYLTLSLLPYLYQQLVEAKNLKMLVNYGMDKMKFGAPVISGKRIRLSASLYNITNLRGTAKVEIKFKLEIEDEKKPALEGIATFLYMFK